jgi:hypothetical protein
MGYELVGQVWDVAGFREYLRTIDIRWAKGNYASHRQP